MVSIREGGELAALRHPAGFDGRVELPEDLQEGIGIAFGVAGELLMGISIVHPGKIGREYFMTKGHFHTIIDTAEIYYCLRGEGYMVMETPEGDTAVEALSPGKVLYVPPRWAHRSVCTGRQEDLVTFFAYPGNAGHDYGTIELLGFRKLVVEGENGPVIIDNPRYQE